MRYGSVIGSVGMCFWASACLATSNGDPVASSAAAATQSVRAVTPGCYERQLGHVRLRITNPDGQARRGILSWHYAGRRTQVLIEVPAATFWPGSGVLDYTISYEGRAAYDPEGASALEFALQPVDADMVAPFTLEVARNYCDLPGFAPTVGPCRDVKDSGGRTFRKAAASLPAVCAPDQFEAGHVTLSYRGDAARDSLDNVTYQVVALGPGLLVQVGFFPVPSHGTATHDFATLRQPGYDATTVEVNQCFDITVVSDHCCNLGLSDEQCGAADF